MRALPGGDAAPAEAGGHVHGEEVTFVAISLDHTLILDEQGKIIGRIEGEARDEHIRSRLDWLFGGRIGKQPKVLQKNDG